MYMNEWSMLHVIGKRCKMNRWYWHCDSVNISRFDIFGYIVADAVGLNSCIAKRIQIKSESRRINKERERERERWKGSDRKAHLYYVSFWIQFSIVSNHKRCSSTYPIVSYQTNFYIFPEFRIYGWHTVRPINIFFLYEKKTIAKKNTPKSSRKETGDDRNSEWKK